MRNGLGYNNPLVQLSSIFGLARQHDSDIALIVDEASGANPEWSTNLALMKWLQQLKTGIDCVPRPLDAEIALIRSESTARSVLCHS